MHRPAVYCLAAVGIGGRHWRAGAALEEEEVAGRRAQDGAVRLCLAVVCLTAALAVAAAVAGRGWGVREVGGALGL
jgi:hypothetical protein